MSKVSLKTYVPRYQKEKWQAHADEWGLSKSEFVRMMVEAGRSALDPGFVRDQLRTAERPVAIESPPGECPECGADEFDDEYAVAIHMGDVHNSAYAPTAAAEFDDDDAAELEDKVMLLLNDGDTHPWHELAARFGYDRDDISGALEAVLQNLQARGVVEHNGRSGGYTLAGGAGRDRRALDEVEA